MISTRILGERRVSRVVFGDCQITVARRDNQRTPIYWVVDTYLKMSDFFLIVQYERSNFCLATGGRFFLERQLPAKPPALPH